MPDGKAVTFARSVDGVSRIMRIDLATGELTWLDLGEVSADSLAWARG